MEITKIPVVAEEAQLVSIFLLFISSLAVVSVGLGPFAYRYEEINVYYISSALKVDTSPYKL